jgi:tetratricopeptide (TPR) repeat protein
MRGWVLAIGAGLALLPADALAQSTFEPVSDADPLLSDRLDLSRAEGLRAEARAAFAAADSVGPGYQVWSAANLWGTEWRPSPTGETNLHVRTPASAVSEDPDAEPTPESLAAEEREARRFAELEAERERLRQDACHLLEAAARAVRDAWTTGRPGIAGPLSWLVRDADYRCQAQRLAILAEIASANEVDYGVESEAFRAALLDYAQALGSAFPRDEAALAEVSARVAALDAARLARLRENLGPDDPALAEALLTLLPSSTDAEARLEGFREAVAIRTRVFGPHDYRTHDALLEVARVLGDAGRYEEADAVRELADPELQTGRSPLDATIGQATAGNLFALFYGVGEFAMAQTVAEERLAKALEDYGRRSPEAGVAAHELGSVLMVRGAYAEAEPFLKAAADIIVAEVRPIAPPTLLSDPGDPDGWLKAAVANYRYAGILGNLGSVLAVQGKNVEAEVNYRQALSLAEAADAVTNQSQRLAVMVGLGEVLVDQGRLAEGRAILEDVLSVANSAPDEGGGSGFAVRAALAAVYEREGRPAVAEPLLRDALSYLDFQNAPYEVRPETGADLAAAGPPLMSALGRLLAMSGRRVAAAALFPRANRAHFRRWCPEGDVRFAADGRYGWTYDDPACQAHPGFIQAVADQSRFLQDQRPRAATRAWRHAGDMALGRTRLRYSRAPDARLDFDAGRAIHQAFVSSSWAASAP